MAAELLEEFGHLDEALQWFNVATTRLDEDELSRAGGAKRMFSYAGQLLMGRRRVRESLGLPEDALDAKAWVPMRGETPFPTAGELLDDLDDASDAPDLVRSLFWPRAEVAGACARWPQTFGSDDDGDYHPRLEANFRELAARGVQRVELVPGTADGLAEFAARHSGTAEAGETRHAFMEDCYLRGLHVTWPPPRNGPCWCGSGAKYKKCCGSPAA